MTFDRKPIWSIAVAAILFALAASPLSAATLVWDPNTDTVNGYKVYWGTSATNPANAVDVGDNTQYSLDSLPLTESTEYFFCVTAYNSAGESDRSTAVSYTPADQTPPMPPGGFSVELQ